MLAARTVAPLTRDTEHHAGLVVTVEGRNGRNERLKKAGVTLEAPRSNGSLEICRSIDVSRAVHPLTKFGPISHGKLKELVLVPIQIGLSLPPGTDDDVETCLASVDH